MKTESNQLGETSIPFADWRPAWPTLLAALMVIAGFLLCGISWWFLILAGVGTFGPGLLREIGLLQDKDEFQMRATHRAGYHAFLVVGLGAFALIAWFRSGEREIQNPGELATLLLALLWSTWFFSSLLDYWGEQRTAFRVLTAFGVVWLAFTIISNTGTEWSGWQALLLHPLLALPFFVLAWLSRRWPRIAGILLLIAGVLFTRFFGFFDDGKIVDDGVTFILFVGPLLACGLALLCVKSDTDELSDITNSKS